MPLPPSSWRGWMSEVSAYSPASTLKPTFASIWPGIEFSAPAICDLRTKRSRSRTSSQGCDHAIRSSVGPRARGSRHSGQPRRTCDSGLLKPSHRPRACSAIHTLTSPPLRQGLLSRGRHLRETSAVENRPDVRESHGTARNGCRRRSKAAGTGRARLPDRQPPECGSACCGGLPGSFWYVECRRDMARMARAGEYPSDRSASGHRSRRGCSTTRQTAAHARLAPASPRHASFRS